MANPTTYFGWVMPTSSSLVTNLPADFNTFGQGVDTSLQDLLGGTTGQVLSKASGTNMDFTWVTPTDQTPLTTKGDLFTFSTVDARLAVGSNGETLVADSSTSTGLRYNANFAAGKNKIINGDFNIWQRGTSLSGAGYLADRFQGVVTTTTVTQSQQAFTAGTAPVAGYEGQYFYRAVTTSGGTAGSRALVQQPIEDVRTFANQTATVSFWAKAGSGTPAIGVELAQVFGSGGSSAVTAIGASAVTISTSWTRYTVTASVPSITGKTIGTGSSLNLVLWIDAGSDFAARASSIGNQSGTFDIWGVQIEAGSVATAFQTATGTLQGELAACQRYYERWSLETSNMAFAGFNASTTNGYHTWHFHTKKRSEPTISVNAAGDFSVRTPGGNITCTAFSTIGTTTDGAWLSTTVASGLGSGNGNFLVNSGVGSFIQASSEL